MTVEKANQVTRSEHRVLGGVSGWLGQYDGPALILIGIVLIAVAAFRFMRTGRLLDDEQTHSATNIRTELILSLVLIMAALAAYASRWTEWPGPTVLSFDQGLGKSDNEADRQKMTVFLRTSVTISVRGRTVTTTSARITTIKIAISTTATWSQ